MVIQVTQKNIRQTPRKVRQVVDTVRGMSLHAAIDQLSVIQRKPTVMLLKMLRQGVADATNNHGWSVDEIGIKSIIVEEGPFYKRFRAVSRGRAHTVEKKTCHVRIEFENTGGKKKVETKNIVSVRTKEKSEKSKSKVQNLASQKGKKQPKKKEK